MSRRMSCSMTIDAVRDRTKTVTRRHVDTWQNLHPGDRLTLIEKGMGLPKGAKQVVLAEVEIVDVRLENLALIYGETNGTASEGLGHMTPTEFVEFWRKGHGYRDPSTCNVVCRRIEWCYISEGDSGGAA